MAKNDMASKFGLSYLSRQDNLSRRDREERASAAQSTVQQAPTTSSPWLEHVYLAIGSAVMYQLGEQEGGCIRLHDLINKLGADDRVDVEVNLEQMLAVAERLVNRDLARYAERDKFGNHLLCKTDV